MNPITMIKASAGSGKTYKLMELLSESIEGGHTAGTAPRHHVHCQGRR
ncbi:MAG: hypothetical protein GX945_04950 [Lentisphaerae bacterium]|jgi:ATP-dependent exoDNAse (exonuclease V) beta subunit|nr:hypothetical protein [Lentisphaerota bacterium]